MTNMKPSTASASLKGTRPGLQMVPLAETRTLSSSLSVERPVFAGEVS